MKKLLFGALALSLAVCMEPAWAGESASANTTVMSASVDADDAYELRGREQLQIMFVNHPELSTRAYANDNFYMVRPDGNISMPLIGSVNVVGKTVEEFTEELTKRYQRYLVKPQITVNVVKYGYTRVYVLGEVPRQGRYNLEDSHSIIDAVSAAGGFSQKSSKGKVIVVHKNANEVAYVANLKEALRHGKTSQNYVLKNGDTVYLTSNHKLGLANILNNIYTVVKARESVQED